MIYKGKRKEEELFCRDWFNSDSIKFYLEPWSYKSTQMYTMEEKKKDHVCFAFGQLSILKYNAKKGGPESQAQLAIF